MNRTITCKNNDGMAITFGNEFSPYLLINCDGVYSVHHNVYTADNTGIDGATYQGSSTQKRNIVLTLAEKNNHQENRAQLYQLFMPKNKGTFIYKEGNEERSIDYYVESLDIESTGNVRNTIVSLICPDPFFEAPNDITVVMAGFVRNFEFVHEFVEGGEELGERISERLKEIENNTGAEGIGLDIKITAIGSVLNPSIIHVEENEFIKIGTTAHPMNMITGDEIRITTGTNNKHVYFTRDGITTEINEFLDEESDFIQLVSGKNTIGYDASSGLEYMTVSITYRYKYLGV